EKGEIEKAPPEPPPGGLILKVYHRYLARDDTGKLRHTTAKDFMSREQLLDFFPGELPKDNKNTETMLRFFLRGFEKSYQHEANQDFMWLTEPEWKSLLPTNPKVGSQAPVPEAIAKRIFVSHLDPVFLVGESNGWPGGAKVIRAGKLTLTVEES